MDAKIDEWVKDIGSSAKLQKWFGHDLARWLEFQHRYKAEVHRYPEQLEKLRALAHEGPLTLMFSAHDEEHNDAVVLRDLILAEAITIQQDMNLVGIADVATGWRMRIVTCNGFQLYGATEQHADAMKSAGLEVAGTYRTSSARQISWLTARPKSLAPRTQNYTGRLESNTSWRVVKPMR